MNESILNHLFLPQYLSSSANDDWLLQNNYQNEHMLLDYWKEYLKSLTSTNTTNMSPVFKILTHCIEQWSVLQNPQTISESKIQSMIEELPPGGFLPLYFHTHNAAVLIEIDENNSNQPLISAWQVLLPSTEITSSVQPHLSKFPVTTYRLNDRSQLTSTAHCELLMDFACNTIEYAKSYKASREVAEIREVPESHYVCQWWIQHFDGIKNEINSVASIQFQKKHRDHIRWNNASLPFRRSGLWMTMKVVFQTILSKRLGNVGIIVYKVLITHFLAYIIRTKPSNSTDLLVHCVRKIVRRLNKIEGLLSTINADNIKEWIQHMKQQIETKIDRIFPKLDWQKQVTLNENIHSNLIFNNLIIGNPEIHRHSCIKLQNHLTNDNPMEPSGLFTNINNYQGLSDVNHADYIPSYDELISKLNYTIGVALTRMEVWLGSNLQQWINRPPLLVDGETRVEILLRFYEKYQSTALKHYYSNTGPTDPIGYSRFIVTSLTIIRATHEKLWKDERFERLKRHSIKIPNIIDLFTFLVLPNREDMIRTHDLYNYFQQFDNKDFPDLLTDIKSEHAFGVYCAGQTPSMDESIQKIRAQADRDEQDKREEVINAKERHRQLMDSVRHDSCSCTYERWNRWTCGKCRTQRRANSIEVTICERPLPSLRNDALAVIFELQMPIEIRCYREILWQFINRLNSNPYTEMYEWLRVPPHQTKLGPFYTGPSNRQVRLVSQTKSVTQTHYRCPPSIVSTSVEGFLFENSLTVHISPTAPVSLAEECRLLTPQLDHSDYKSLQFTINNTQFVQNDVIAKLSDCPARLKPTQFVEFGSFRSGHRLQWWNLLTVLEMDSLSIGEESVAILIIHSILQYGPLSTDSDIFSDRWCPESHQQLLKDHFIDELISRLDHHLDHCELNWQNELQ